jgi:hypothetical protein
MCDDFCDRCETCCPLKRTESATLQTGTHQKRPRLVTFTCASPLPALKVAPHLRPAMGALRRIGGRRGKRLHIAKIRRKTRQLMLCELRSPFVSGNQQSLAQDVTPSWKVHNQRSMIADTHRARKIPTDFPWSSITAASGDIVGFT